ncbi:response regulator transcription factor [Terriglobus roseus]|uniref:Two-component system, OmpR family, KDP operon response regulator KdpE n=1 Tax=Terriglobus roseus TaxID=392734 RepID=A0A1G7HEX0_9BACT|nr:response regulator transcription factor [Terriglobus roseus]SDE99032.1 two-component system, OmpR family, KDP operon response regulator KdpE [Terriglobus roseus]
MPTQLMTARRRVLVVDDESSITRTLRASFLANGYDVRTAHDGVSALNVLEDWDPEVVVTDLTMPEMDGVELCKRIRSYSSIPIILLSVQDATSAKIRGLDAGADDYVTKPFSIDELLARVRGSLRRLDALRTSDSTSTETKMLRTGDFSVNTLTRHVTVSEIEVKLTPREYDLLLFFLRNVDRVLTHSSIIQSVWGPYSTHQQEYLRVLVATLRKKIERDPNHPRYLLTDPWVGYRLNPNPEE